MSFYNQHNRLDNPNQQLSDKDGPGRYLTRLLFEQLGYQLTPTEEKYDAGDDVYTNDHKTILIEARTNVRLWDAALQPKSEICNWVRRNKSKSDIYTIWGAYTRNSWIGVVLTTQDVLQAPIRPRGASNVKGQENVRWVPYNAIKMVCLITNMKNGTTRVEYWDYRKHPINNWSTDIIAHNTSYLPHEIDNTAYNLKPFKSVF